MDEIRTIAKELTLYKPTIHNDINNSVVVGISDLNGKSGPHNTDTLPVRVNSR